MDGGWATSCQKFKRRILDVSIIYADPFSFTSTGKYLFNIIYLIFNVNVFLGNLNHINKLSMGTIVATMVQTVEHYFMQFNSKNRSELKKSPIQVIILK